MQHLWRRLMSTNDSIVCAKYQTISMEPKELLHTHRYSQVLTGLLYDLQAYWTISSSVFLFCVLMVLGRCSSLSFSNVYLIITQNPLHFLPQLLQLVSHSMPLPNNTCIFLWTRALLIWSSLWCKVHANRHHNVHVITYDFQHHDVNFIPVGLLQISRPLVFSKSVKLIAKWQQKIPSVAKMNEAWMLQ